MPKKHRKATSNRCHQSLELALEFDEIQCESTADQNNAGRQNGGDDGYLRKIEARTRNAPEPI